MIENERVVGNALMHRKSIHIEFNMNIINHVICTAYNKKLTKKRKVVAEKESKSLHVVFIL